MGNHPLDIGIAGKGVVLHHVEEGSRCLHKVFKGRDGNFLVDIGNHDGRLCRVHHGQRTTPIQLGHQFIQPLVTQVHAAVVGHQPHTVCVQLI